MDYVQMRKKGQITLPKAVRETLSLAEGDLLAVQVREGELVLRPQQVIDRDQAWFWTPDWQAAEAEAEADIKAGRTNRFETVDALVDDLHQAAAELDKESA